MVFFGDITSQETRSQHFTFYSLFVWFRNRAMVLTISSCHFAISKQALFFSFKRFNHLEEFRQHTKTLLLLLFRSTACWQTFYDSCLKDQASSYLSNISIAYFLLFTQNKKQKSYGSTKVNFIIFYRL